MSNLGTTRGGDWRYSAGSWDSRNPVSGMGKSVLRDHIDATIGFQNLGALTEKPSQSLIRMLGPSSILKFATIPPLSVAFRRTREFT